MMQNESHFKDKFRLIANTLVGIISSHWSFLFFLSAIVIWFALGFWSGFSEHWQSVLHIGLSIITFLMVLLIEHVQHRDTKAIHIKLDELLKGVEGARNDYINIQDKPEQHLDKLQDAAKDPKTDNSSLSIPDDNAYQQPVVGTSGKQGKDNAYENKVKIKTFKMSE